MLTSSSENEAENIRNAHIMCLIYIFFKSSKHKHDLSIGFHRDFDTRERDLIDNKRTKRSYRSRFFSKYFWLC